MQLSAKASERLAELLGEFEKSRTWRAQYEQNWRAYLGAFRAGEQVNDGFVQPQCETPRENIVFSTVRIAAAASTLGFPKIFADPKNAKAIDNALFVEKALTCFWEVLKIQPRVFKPAVLDALLTGVGWIKTTYAYKEVPADPSDELVERVWNMAANATTEDTPPTREFVRSKLKADYVRKIVLDSPEVNRVSVADMWVDSTATSQYDARWFMHRFYWSMDRVKDTYNTKEGEVTAGATVRPELLSEGDEGSSSTLVELYELYDVERKQMITLAGAGRVPITKWVDTSSLPEGHPFTVVSCFDSTDRFYGSGFVEYLLGIQNSLDHVWQRVLDFMDEQVSKMAAPASLLHDAQAAEALQDPENCVVPIPDNLIERFGGMDLLRPLPGHHTDLNALLAIRAALIDAANRTTGVSDYERGGSLGFRTATEVSRVTAYSSARSEEFADMLRRSMSDVGRRILKFLQQNRESELMLRLEQSEQKRLPPARRDDSVTFLGPEGEARMISVGTEDFDGDWDISIQAGSTTPITDQQRIEKAQAFVSMMMPLAGTGAVDLNQLLVYLLTEGFQIKNPERFLTFLQPNFGSVVGQASQPGQATAPAGAGQPAGTPLQALNGGL